MLPVFRYIVFLIFAFNICISNAADITLDLEEDEETVEIKSPAALNLPHPIQLGQILHKETDSAIARFLILGKYFDKRYPGTALETDFSEDVSQIFPQASQEDILKYTDRIKKALWFYRFGKQKLADIKEKLLTPKDPPLTVDDDEYALPGDTEYISTDDQSVVVISDFKKVIGYGHNPREVAATKKYLEKLAFANRPKTDFEHFQTMIEKIELSKLSSYGITLPSPFVGNAGIGSWVEEKGFRVRLISEKARVFSTKPFLTALHLDIPLHRIVVATSLKDKLVKPKIVLKNTQNIKTYKIFEPLPVSLIAKEMIGGYRGNLAFPIEITPEEPQKDIVFQADFMFQSCDERLDCEILKISPSLLVQASFQDEDISSSMGNFIRQSYYNIPQDHNKYVFLENLSYLEDENHNISQINLTFKYNTTVKNFALFLENNFQTSFLAPQVIIADKYIYVKIQPFENTENLLDAPLRITVRVNNYAVLRQTVDLKNFQPTNQKKSLFKLCLAALLSIILFYLTPFGFPFALKPFYRTQENQNWKNYFLLKSTGFIFCLAVLIFYLNKNLSFLYNPQGSPFYVSSALMYLYLQFKVLSSFDAQSNRHFIFNPLFDTFGVIFFLMLGDVFHVKNLIFEILNLPYSAKSFIFFSFILGLLTPEILRLFVLKYEFSEKSRIFFILFAKLMLIIAMILSLLWLILPLKSIGILKIFALLGLSLFVLAIIVNFWKALIQTDLPQAHILNTEKVLFVLSVFLVCFFASRMQKIAFTNTKTATQTHISEAMQNVKKGENVLLAIYPPSCLKCAYNNFTVFTKHNLNILKKKYQLKYIPLVVNNINQDIFTRLKQYNQSNLPLYILYTPLVPDGALLPDFLTLSALTQTIQNFNP